jgi:hypothetical protein
MLPDLRLVAIATLSTFVVSLCVGLFAASRLELEPIAVRAQPHAKVDDNIVERVSMNWTESERHRAAALRELADEMANLPAKAVSPIVPAPDTTARGQATIDPKLPQAKAEDSRSAGPVGSEQHTDLPPAVSIQSAIAPAVQPTGNDRVTNTDIQQQSSTADIGGTASKTIIATTSDARMAPAKADDAATPPNAGREKPAALTATEPATKESAPDSAATAKSDVTATTSIAASEKAEPKIAAPAPIAATEKSTAAPDRAMAAPTPLPKVAARAVTTDDTDGTVDRPDAGTRKDELPIAMPDDASDPLLQRLAPSLNKPIHRRRKPAVTPAFNGVQPLLPGQIGSSNGDVGALPPFPFFNTQSRS